MHPDKLYKHFAGLNNQEIDQLIPTNSILLGYRGSISHGMYSNPNKDSNSIDDKDAMGIYISPIDCYFGLDKHRHYERQIKEWDVVSYELIKAMTLLTNANPNVLGLLWLRNVDYIHVMPAGQKIINNRKLFVSKKLYHSFSGYAHGQLHRMTHFKFEGYMGEKRKMMVEQFGYDPKHAAHCIRLLRMGIEFLNEGELHVFREDAQQLGEIKRGEWTLDQIKTEADRLFKRAEEAYDRCQLPNQADREKINELTVEILRDHFKMDRYLYEGG